MRRVSQLAFIVALTVVMLGNTGCVIVVPVPVPARDSSPASSWVDTSGAGDPAVPEGPRLASVASLPVDASSEGTIQGTPTGEADSNDTYGTFELVLDPAPAGLPPRTTLGVGFDHSTEVYRDGQAVGDPLRAMNSENGPFDADPSAAGTVKVRFHVKDGRVFADRLDLSNEFP